MTAQVPTHLDRLASHRLVLRHYQHGVVRWMCQRESQGLGGLAVLGCGFGKTEMAIAVIILDPRPSLWITKPHLEQEAAERISHYVGRSRVVLLREDDAALDNLKCDSIYVAAYSMLAKWQDRLAAAGFGRVIVDELQATKDGHNNYDALIQISAPASRRWGLTATPYNNHWSDLKDQLAWITKNGDLRRVKDESVIKQLVRPMDSSGQFLAPEWCLHAQVPTLNFKASSRLIVIPFVMAAEVVIARSARCQKPERFLSKRLVLGQYKQLLEQSAPGLEIDSEANAAKRPKTDASVHSSIDEWVCSKKLPALEQIGDMTASFVTAQGLTPAEAEELLQHGQLPSKAFFVVAHANYIHPNSAVIVSYLWDDLATVMNKQFLVTPVHGMHGQCRTVFHVQGKNRTEVVQQFTQQAREAREQGTAPPVLLAQVAGLEGTDGLQEVCNVMYQTALNDNPQRDVQAAERVLRSGQTSPEAHLYRIMVDTYVEHYSLQRQVEKAGGWRQWWYNGREACTLLDLPKYWTDE